MKKNVLILLLTTLTAVSFAAEEKTPPPSPKHHHHHKQHSRYPKFSEKFFSHFPEAERKRLKELETKDPQAFREAIREHFRKKREQEHQAFEALRQKYLKEEDPARKAAAKEEIRSILTKKIEWHIKIAEGQIKQNEKKVKYLQKRQEKLKADLDRMNNGKEKIVEEILTKVLDPSYKPPQPPRKK